MMTSCSFQQIERSKNYDTSTDSLVIYIDTLLLLSINDEMSKDAWSTKTFVNNIEPCFVIRDTSITAFVKSAISNAVFDTLRVQYSPRLNTIPSDHPLYKPLSKPFYVNGVDCWFAALFYHDTITDTIGFGKNKQLPIQINNLQFRDSLLYNKMYSLCMYVLDSDVR